MDILADGVIFWYQLSQRKKLDLLLLTIPWPVLSCSVGPLEPCSQTTPHTLVACPRLGLALQVV